MTFSAKIFFSILLTTIVGCLLIVFSIYFLLKKDIEKEYFDRYNSLGAIVANTFHQMETTTDVVNKNSITALSERIRLDRKIPSDKELDAFAKSLGITSFYVIDSNGRFLRSSDLPIEQQTNSLFSYSSDYRNLVHGNLDVALTPIIPSFPLNIPAKFTMMPNDDRTLILESGTQLKFISQLLRQAVMSDKNITSIGLYAPTGFELGSINSTGVFHQGKFNANTDIFFGKKVQGNNVIFSLKVPASVGVCPECIVKGVSKNGEYFYILKTEVSLLPLLKRLDILKNFLFIILLASLIISIIVSNLLAKKLVSRIHKISKTTNDIISSGNLNLQVEVEKASDEVSKLAITFNKMIESLRTSQAHLIAAEKSRGMAQLATQVAHDIRSPLLVLKRVLSDLSSLPEKKRIDIRNAIQRVTDIANNLLSQYKHEKHLANVTTTLASAEPVAMLLESIVSEKRIQISDPHIEIHLNISPNTYDTFIYVDIIGFKRVLSNLINNAIEAVKGRKGIIDIDLKKHAEKVLITIKDNGCGIPKDKLVAVLEEGASFGKAEGSGLGLPYAVHKITEWHGDYSLHSEVGQGTQFEIILPEVKPAAWFKTAIHVPSDSVIVILDDDDYIHQIWDERFPKAVREKYHLQLFHFNNPKDFIDFCRNKTFAKTLFLLDYELDKHEETGLSLAKLFNLGAAATLVTSRYEDHEIRESCIALGIKIIPKYFAELTPVHFFNLTEIVFIDDEKMITEVWQESAEAAGKSISVFTDPTDFMRIAHCYAKDTIIYIDASLGHIKGEDVAKTLYEQGYHQLYLATGYPKEHFKDIFWVKDILGKEPPWE